MIREALEERQIHNNERARVTITGNITEIMTMGAQPKKIPVKKISKTEYINTKTGEIGEYKNTNNKAENEQSIRRTIAKIRNIINTNITEAENVRFVTLTYKKNMQDVKMLYKDYEKYWKRYETWRKQQGHEKAEYIAIAEPQERGAWHLHQLLIYNQKAPYIDNKELSRVWGHGFTKATAIDNVDNVGAYLSAYLANTESEKGGRLHLYPLGMNIYRKSKGIREPTTYYTDYGEAQKKVSAQTLTYKKNYNVIDDTTNEIVNTITKEFYNSKRIIK